MTLTQSLIEKYEGCELTAYQDSLGVWTCGYGHELEPQDKNWAGFTITQAQADSWLTSDMAVAETLAQQFPYFENLNEARQACLISMCFQLGSQPLHWPNFMASLEAQNYTQAAANGLDSEWAKQTPERADQEMAMLASGECT
jgi:lysozyme